MLSSINRGDACDREVTVIVLLDEELARETVDMAEWVVDEL